MRTVIWILFVYYSAISLASSTGVSSSGWTSSVSASSSSSISSSSAVSSLTTGTSTEGVSSFSSTTGSSISGVVSSAFSFAWTSSSFPKALLVAATIISSAASTSFIVALLLFNTLLASAISLFSSWITFASTLPFKLKSRRFFAACMSFSRASFVDLFAVFSPSGIDL